MSVADARTDQSTGEALVAAALDGDEAAFTTLAERYRRELQLHCYRMLASYHDAEDVVQEALLKAWRKRDSLRGRSSFRAWLYRIATNACLDFLRHHQRGVVSSETHASGEGGLARPPHIPWLEPYPDRLLDPVAPQAAEPDARAIAKETIELAFLVALQFLPAKQRAVLILRDVLDWSAQETAELLEASVASVNSALRRARATLLRRRPARALEWAPDREPGEQERLLLERYVDATERNDPAAIAALLRDDVRFAMPPEPGTYAGRDVVVGGWVEGGFGSDWFGPFRCLITRANRMPAVACYHHKPGESVFHPLAVDVLRIEGGLVAEVTAFPLGPFVEAFGLPATL